MLLIIAAVPLETVLLRKQIQGCRSEKIGSCRIETGKLFGTDILMAHSGVGQSAMALQLTRLLERYSPAAVLLCGCAGSYPNSGLKNGDLAVASEEIYGDLGVYTTDQFIPLAELDIPLQPGLTLSCQQRYPLRSDLTDMARQVLPHAHFGPFVTVSGCSGYPELGKQLEQRTGGSCENMEGAAAAQVCAEYQLPLLELRGISNPTGSRKPADWNIQLGAEQAQLGLLQILQHWPDKQDETCNS